MNSSKDRNSTFDRTKSNTINGLTIEPSTLSYVFIVNDFNILTLDDYLSKMHCIVGSGN